MMKTKELTAEFKDKSMGRKRSEEGHETIHKLLRVHKITVGFIIIKFKKKKYRITQTFPSFCCPTKQSSCARRALVKEVTRNARTTLTELKFILLQWEILPKGQHQPQHFTDLDSI